MKCALLTCEDLSNFLPQEESLHLELNKNGFDVENVIWTQSQDWSKYDVALIRTTWDYTHHLDLFLNTLSEIEQSTCHLFNSLELIKWNTKKNYLQDLEKNGSAIISTLWYDSLPSRIEDIFVKLDAPEIILKPQISASAENTFRIKRENLCPREELIRSSLKGKPFMAQPFMEEILTQGETSLFYFNGKFSHAAKKIPKQGDFRVQEEHGGVITADSPSEEIINQGQAVLKSLNEQPLYARVDGIVNTQNQLKLMELELIEPSLYLHTSDKAAYNLVTALKARL